MTDVFAESTPPSLRHVRLDTLVRLRWLAVLGQTAAVLVVYDGFDFEVPFWACLGVIATYAATNIALRMRFKLNQRLEPHQAAWLLGLDIIELAGLLFLAHAERMNSLSSMKFHPKLRDRRHIHLRHQECAPSARWCILVRDMR